VAVVVLLVEPPGPLVVPALVALAPPALLAAVVPTPAVLAPPAEAPVLFELTDPLLAPVPSLRASGSLPQAAASPATSAQAPHQRPIFVFE
jgi:hypothetical protein